VMENQVVEQRLRDALTTVAESEPISEAPDLDEASGIASLDDERSRRRASRSRTLIGVAAATVVVIAVGAVIAGRRDAQGDRVAVKPVAPPARMTFGRDIVRYAIPKSVLASPDYPAFTSDDAAACDHWTVTDNRLTCDHILGWLGQGTVGGDVAVDTLYLDQIPEHNVTIQHWIATHDRVDVDGKRGWIDQTEGRPDGSRPTESVAEVVVEEEPGRYVYVRVTGTQPTREAALELARSLQREPIGVDALPLVAAHVARTEGGPGGWATAGTVHGRPCFGWLPGGRCEPVDDRARMGSTRAFGGVLWARGDIARVQAVVRSRTGDAPDRVVDEPVIATDLDLGPYHLFAYRDPSKVGDAVNRIDYVGYDESGKEVARRVYADSCFDGRGNPIPYCTTFGS
jgi:hypothetical protein